MRLCVGVEPAFLRVGTGQRNVVTFSVYLSDYRGISQFVLLILLLLTFAKPAVSFPP